MNQSKEIGLRIRRARQARNWSQEKLAEKADLSTATIGKYEVEGLSDIDKINKLSELLGQNLFADERDMDATIGEIGKQILVELIKDEGYMDFEEMVTSHLYGLSRAVATEEIFRLEKTGQCVREQFNDFNGSERDVLFLTAKGLITCRNQITNPLVQKEIEDNIGQVRTYECILKDNKGTGIRDAVSYQDYINLRPGEILIRQLKLCPDFYMADYIVYLKKNFESGIDMDKFPDDDVPTWIPCNDFYHDLIYRMIFGLGNRELRGRIDWDEYWEIYDRYDINWDEFNAVLDEKKMLSDKLDVLSWDDIIMERLPKGDYDAWMRFQKEIPWIFGCEDDLLSEGDDDPEDIRKAKKRLKEINDAEQAVYERSKLVEDHFAEFFYDASQELKERFNKLHPDGLETYAPDEMFTAEEIGAFIRENYPEQKTESQILIDEKIRRIMELIPETRNYFGKEEKGFRYSIPRSWYDNGLKELAEKFCIPQSLQPETAE